MALWVDKYRPTQFSQLNYHQELTESLSELVEAENFPHLLFYGPEGAGKSTRIRCILKKLYGNGAENLKSGHKSLETAFGKILEFLTVVSPHHIEVTPSDVGIHDRIVVQDIIKQVSEVQNFEPDAQRTFKVVIIMEADTLTKDAQHALRQTMRKYAGTCKIIMCCNSVSKIMDSLLNECMVVRVSAPNNDDIKSCLRTVANGETLNVSDRFLDAIAERSNGNLRRAIDLLECASAQYGKRLDHQKVSEPDWRRFILDTALMIVQNCTSDGLLKARQRLYDLLTRCIPTSVIFEERLDALLPYCDAEIRRKVIEAAAHFEHTSVLGSKDIYHLDAFVATFMTVYKNHQAMGHH